MRRALLLTLLAFPATAHGEGPGVKPCLAGRNSQITVRHTVKCARSITLLERYFAAKPMAHWTCTARDYPGGEGGAGTCRRHDGKARFEWIPIWIDAGSAAGANERPGDPR